MPESEERKAYRREWARRAYAENPEKFQSYARDQHQKHNEKKRAASAKYRAENRDKIRAKQKLWRDANKDTLRRNNLKRIGFTPELFDEMMRQQGGLCAVCSVDLAQLPSKRVHADHCHTTNQARGILCHHCNSALGLLREDPQLFKRAVEYLEEPTSIKMKRRRA